ncbi:hypothetical protein M0R45_002630 [Rubus argutus]|uniref:Uncharacterized protein n=1 Tax=Rubus argutus TaxID=59490 RepID=A0AAW1VMB6_RUBAR
MARAEWKRKRKAAQPVSTSTTGRAQPSSDVVPISLPHNPIRRTRASLLREEPRAGLHPGHAVNADEPKPRCQRRSTTEPLPLHRRSF